MITGKAGDGHVDTVSRSMHLVTPKGGDLASLESLVAHEATHVLVAERWGTPGTPLIGEGLAVWTAGAYGGRDLVECKKSIPGPLPSVAELAGPGFRALPEETAYPLSGILVDTLIKEVGLDGVRRHFLPATAGEWDATCRKAGIPSVKLEKAFRKAARAKN